MTTLFWYPDFDPSPIPILIFPRFLSSAIFCIIYPSPVAGVNVCLLGFRSLRHETPVFMCVRIGYVDRRDTQGVRFLATALRQTTISDCVLAVSQKSRETTGETWLCLELGMKSPVGIEGTTVKGTPHGVGLLMHTS